MAAELARHPRARFEGQARWGCRRLDRGLDQLLDRITAESVARSSLTHVAQEEDDEQRTIVVEFGALTDEQRMFIDLHSLRAVGTVMPEPVRGRVIVEFWLREGDTPTEAYDEIRGWAIGNRLPISGLVED